MKRLMKKLEDIMVAITFAEAGEYDTAMEVMGEKPLMSGSAGGAEETIQKTVTEPA